MIKRTNQAIEKATPKTRSLFRDQRGGANNHVSELGLLALALLAIAAFVVIGKAIQKTAKGESQGIQQIYQGN